MTEHDAGMTRPPAAIEDIKPDRLGGRTRRRWLRGLVAATCLALLAWAGVVLEVPARLQGWARGEPFFDGRPLHAWAEDLSRHGLVGQLADVRLRAGEEAAVPILVGIAADQGRSVGTRRRAIELLGRRETAGAAPALAALLEDVEPSIRESATRALGGIGEGARPVVPALCKALTRPLDPQRGDYARALEQIGGSAAPMGVFAQFRDPHICGERPWHWLQFSSDGRRLVAHRGQDLLVWDRSAGPVERESEDSFTIVDGVREAAFHPNAEKALVADVVGRLTGYRVGRPWERVSTADRLVQQDLPVAPLPNRRRLAYSPDGRTLAVIRGESVELYDATRFLWERLTHFRDLPQRVRSVLFSADGGTVALLDDTKLEGAPRLSEGAWALVNVKTGKLRRRLPAGHVTGNETSLSADGRLLAVNADGVRREVSVWSVEGGRRVSTCGDPSGWGILSVAFVGADRLAIGTAGGGLSLWDVKTGAKVRELPWHRYGVEALALSPDGKTLASADQCGWVKLWDLSDGRPGG